MRHLLQAFRHTLQNSAPAPPPGNMVFKWMYLSHTLSPIPITFIFLAPLVEFLFNRLIIYHYIMLYYHISVSESFCQ